MRYHQLIESNNELLKLYSLLDLETLESFLKSFKELYRVDPENAKLISNEQSVIRERMKQKQLKSKLLE